MDFRFTRANLARIVPSPSTVDGNVIDNDAYQQLLQHAYQQISLWLKDEYPISGESYATMQELLVRYRFTKDYITRILEGSGLNLHRVLVSFGMLFTVPNSCTSTVALMTESGFSSTHLTRMLQGTAPYLGDIAPFLYRFSTTGSNCGTHSKLHDLLLAGLAPEQIALILSYKAGNFIDSLVWLYQFATPDPRRHYALQSHLSSLMSMGVRPSSIASILSGNDADLRGLCSLLGRIALHRPRCEQQDQLRQLINKNLSVQPTPYQHKVAKLQEFLNSLEEQSTLPRILPTTTASAPLYARNVTSGERSFRTLGKVRHYHAPEKESISPTHEVQSSSVPSLNQKKSPATTTTAEVTLSVQKLTNTKGMENEELFNYALKDLLSNLDIKEQEIKPKLQAIRSAHSGRGIEPILIGIRTFFVDRMHEDKTIYEALLESGATKAAAINSLHKFCVKEIKPNLYYDLIRNGTLARIATNGLTVDNATNIVAGLAIPPHETIKRLRKFVTKKINDQPILQILGALNISAENFVALLNHSARVLDDIMRLLEEIATQGANIAPGTTIEFINLGNNIGRLKLEVKVKRLTRYAAYLENVCRAHQAPSYSVPSSTTPIPTSVSSDVAHEGQHATTMEFAATENSAKALEGNAVINKEMGLAMAALVRLASLRDGLYYPNQSKKTRSEVSIDDIESYATLEEAEMAERASGWANRKRSASTPNHAHKKAKNGAGYSR